MKLRVRIVCLVDGQTLPFKDCSFDLVTAFQIIEHIPETVTFTEELKRVLRRDGVVLITTPNATIRLDPAMKPWNPFHVREYSHEELSERSRSNLFSSNNQGIVRSTRAL